MAGEHVLAVDDEPRYLRMISFNLEHAGYRVTCAGTGEDALALFERYDPDLVLLDLMLPGLDGFEVCERMRESSNRPIIILTARGAEEDKVKGLRLGADDYVTKPFSAPELLARVEAVLRRAGRSEERRSTLEFGELRIDHLGKRVTIRGEDVHLSPTEYKLLACLAGSVGIVLSRDELLEKVWGPAYHGEHDLLRLALWRLRQKLQDDAARPRYIVTRPGVGYMFAAQEQL
jgi:two-component system KDP operon response regulator KdpE